MVAHQLQTACLDGFVVSAQCRMHHSLIGDYVAAFAGLHSAYRQHLLVKRVGLTREHRLQQSVQSHGRGQRVMTQMRQRAVRSQPGYRNVELAGRGHQRAVRACNLARWQRGHHVHAIYLVHIGVFHAVLGYYAFSAAVQLFGGLEQYRHIAAQMIALFGAKSRHCKHGGHMAIVTAGVHEARALRAEVKPGRLGNIERIHIGAQRYRAAAFALLKRRPAHENAAHAGVGDGVQRVRRKRPETVQYVALGLELGMAQLGYAVQCAAVAAQPIQRARYIVAPYLFSIQ